ncbi:MAG: aminotransferase class III-fold pyridoxal phosphate-dependent enzyme [Woeseiaceae bacterium]|nr:aminotransferase class III-fold pyridoxal phosphate-dependent enzyme [Woeseiaceae bacterium]
MSGLPGEHNGTFRGNCHAFVTARAALRHFWRDREKFEKDIAAKAKILEDGLRAIMKANASTKMVLKGRGMMRGLEMPSGEFAGKVIKHAFENGMIIESAGPKDEVVKCLAALTISAEDLEKGLKILGEAVAAVARQAEKAAA